VQKEDGNTLLKMLILARIMAMGEKNKDNYQRLIEAIKKGSIGILPTDTLYGLVGSAMSPQAVEKMYDVRERNDQKPFIILISSLADLGKFNIKISKKTAEKLAKIWPGKVSVVFPVKSKKFQYLHRGGKTLAFRLPKNENLIKLIKKTGPLVAPSANREGGKPATTIKKAKQYFGEKIYPVKSAKGGAKQFNRVNFYVDGGTLRSKPSTLIAFEKDKIITLRAGAVNVDKIFSKK
jgi:L-threonylcarbamoyladenylate synthase